MRILVLFTSLLLESRGTPSRSRNLARALCDQPGNELLVLSADPRGSLMGAVDAAHYSLAGPNVTEQLRIAAERFRPHIVYGQTDKAERPLARLGLGHGQRIVDLHGNLAAEKLEQLWKPRSRRLRAYLRHRLDELRWRRKMDGFTVVTEQLASRVRRFGKPVAVVWGGVDPETFSALPALPGAQVTVAYAGNFRPYQGLDVLVEAMTRLDARFRLLLVGDPTGGEELLARARRALGDRLTVRPPVPYAEIPAVLASADVLTVPRPRCRSAHFGFPSKLPEYLALGRAVVVSDVGEQARVVRDGETGLVVPPGSAAALAVALKRLADPQLRHRLGKAGRREAETRLSWQQVGRRLQAFLQRIVALRSADGRLSGEPAMPRG